MVRYLILFFLLFYIFYISDNEDVFHSEIQVLKYLVRQKKLLKRWTEDMITKTSYHNLKSCWAFKLYFAIVETQVQRAGKMIIIVIYKNETLKFSCSKHKMGFFQKVPVVKCSFAQKALKAEFHGAFTMNSHNHSNSTLDLLSLAPSGVP